jgi:Zn finger protein HypA/HybF involved in hydrogenase expression
MGSIFNNSYEKRGNISYADRCKLESEMANLKVTCKCGHKEIMPVYVDKTRCSHCNRTLYNNTKAYFKYKMRKELENGKKEKEKK